MLNKKDILWVFCNSTPAGIASNIVNGILPAIYLDIKKIIFLPKHSPKETLDRFNPRIIVLGKVIGDPGYIINFIKEAQSRNIKVIIPLPDWNLLSETDWDIQQNNTKLLLAKNVDYIVLQTLAASNYIKENLGFNSKIIPDCIRFTSNNSISKINIPLKIVWFGNTTNHDTFLNNALPEIYSSGLNLKIKVITSDKNRIINNANPKYLDKIKLECIEWTSEMDKEVLKSDIVIIPYPNDKRRLVKTQNRITDSMSMGRFVIASDMPFTKEFEKYCFLGNLGDGLKWVLKNKDKAIIKAQNGKHFSDINFGVKKIANMWMSFFEEII